MTKPILLVSMRQDHVGDYAETRDSLDINWFKFASLGGYVAIPVPNQPETAKHLLEQLDYCGIILSGGNTLVKYGGSCHDREETERLLLEHAQSKNRPVLGVCRGFQFLLDYFAEPLVEVNHHVGNRHTLTTCQGAKLTKYIEQLEEVNSYHNFAAKSLSTLSPVAYSPDRLIEAAEHPSLPVYGIMWHPERETNLALHAEMLLPSLFSQGQKT